MRHGSEWGWWRPAMVLLALGGLPVGTGCLQVNKEHCMFAGGDFACDGGEGFCVGAVDGWSEAIEDADSNGCIAALPGKDVEGNWVHVKYGLPIAVMMADANGHDPETDTVEGIVTRLLATKGAFDASKCAEMLPNIESLRNIHDRIMSEDGKPASVTKLTFSSADLKQVCVRNPDILDQCDEGFQTEIDALLPMLEADCVLPIDTTGTTTGLDTTATEQSSSSTTADPICTQSEDCEEPAKPICVDEVCVGCDQAPEGECAAKDPTMPACVGSGERRGECVQCTALDSSACTDMTPICDDATYTCIPCTAHEQCGGAACNLFTGACLPTDPPGTDPPMSVVHVGMGQQYATLGDAVASFAPNAEGTIIVHAGAYNESVAVSLGRVLAFLAAEIGPELDPPPQWISSMGDMPQLTVDTGATVLVDGMELTGNLSTMVPGLRVDGGADGGVDCGVDCSKAWLDRTRIILNNGGSITAQNNATLVLRSCFVGDGSTGEHALLVNDSSATVLSTTLGAGVDNFGNVYPVFCVGSVDVTIRNSFLVSFDNPSELSCLDATVTYTASEALIPGAGNVALGNIGMNWFADVDAGDFHLDMPPAMLATTALWQDDELTTDIDGEPRPDTDGSPGFAGADVPTP